MTYSWKPNLVKDSKNYILYLRGASIKVNIKMLYDLFIIL